LQWPAFPEDPRNTQWPIETSSAVLLLNGDLDPQTPIELAQQFAPKLVSPHQTFATLPFSAHDTVVQAWARSADDVPCGYRILLDFLQHPQNPDTSCVDDTLPVSFDSTSEQAETWFGTSDLWGGPDSTDGGLGDAATGDGSPGDGSPNDAEPGDGSPDDAAPHDATPSDGAPSDATPDDATPSDATPDDAAPSDATPGDAGPPDATEAGPTDAGHAAD
jgi:hypothetical protein